MIAESLGLITDSIAVGVLDGLVTRLADIAALRDEIDVLIATADELPFVH
jgi:hypothetical protein